MSKADIKYPKIKIKLTGRNGNAFVLLGAMDAALKKGGVSDAERKQFQAEATSGDYDHLLRTCMEWADVS